MRSSFLSVSGRTRLASSPNLESEPNRRAIASTPQRAFKWDSTPLTTHRDRTTSPSTYHCTHPLPAPFTPPPALPFTPPTPQSNHQFMPRFTPSPPSTQPTAGTPPPVSQWRPLPLVFKSRGGIPVGGATIHTIPGGGRAAAAIPGGAPAAIPVGGALVAAMPEGVSEGRAMPEEGAMPEGGPAAIPEG